MYVISATIKIKDKNGYTKIIQIPTFYLNEDVQGIINVEHARAIAMQVINPMNDYEASIGVAKV